MTAAEYRSAGFKLSANVSQTEIDNAERLTAAAYIEPIKGNSELQPSNDLAMSLAFLCLLRQSVFATRAGAKIKTTAVSSTADEAQSVSTLCTTCGLLLSEFRKTAENVEGAKANAVINDINKIYFRSSFLDISNNRRAKND